ncbi:MAG: hypothetical protein SF069_08775 [Phycisphaerae bacterium]|nr:hypothetical protein [Phycisphaerae bacterium]
MSVDDHQQFHRKRRWGIFRNTTLLLVAISVPVIVSHFYWTESRTLLCDQCMCRVSEQSSGIGFIRFSSEREFATKTVGKRMHWGTGFCSNHVALIQAQRNRVYPWRFVGQRFLSEYHFDTDFLAMDRPDLLFDR